MRSKPSRLLLAVLVPLALVAAACGDKADESASGGGGQVVQTGDTIKVGVLHSLSGTMSISEVSVRDATLLAIEEINAKGGVLGKQIQPVVEDGASDWPTFA